MLASKLEYQRIITNLRINVPKGYDREVVKHLNTFQTETNCHICLTDLEKRSLVLAKEVTMTGITAIVTAAIPATMT